MGIVFDSKVIETGKIVFAYESETFSGVNKVAKWVSNDIEALIGRAPKAVSVNDIEAVDLADSLIMPATIGRSEVATRLVSEGYLGIEEISGKREVYTIKVLSNVEKSLLCEGAKGCFESIIVILGSDKRGTVYGLFKLSELMGISPLINWMDIKPKRTDKFVLADDYEYTSKEPSVRYRGFFINDEWPAFGNFCNHNFGGFNAGVYEKVFELLLRLKGNYLWPAMWSAIFPDDGPGLANAELADELGVVMGASHHEPCLRQGEEYKYLRGADSIYGDAWNFITNEEGITRFWEDGLKRSGKFENVITVGMRGECDTAIMGRDATLKDNIDLLRNVLRTQNSLIRKYVNEDLDSVPRMLALYKEVEPYFYGDENTEGLMGDPELEGVTLMLCDDNYGNLRTVPTKEMRDHKGGYGMYYHFDYHGLPISFEWFNTSYLPKVWEQMTTAYDNGIRDLWIVNVGDIFSNEYPLSFFLDLAYDYDKWGTSNLNSALLYTTEFVARQFGNTMSEAEQAKTAELLLGYTKITGARRTEAMNSDIYAPFAYGECEELLDRIQTLMKDAKTLYKSLSKESAFGFYELVYLPLTANLNVQKMWLLTTVNHGLADYGNTAALSLPAKINKCIDKDRDIVKKLHGIHDEKWYGMGLSEHIGFKYWCEEECAYPVIHTFEPANKNRLIVSIPGTNQHTEGMFWTGRVMTLGDMLDPRCDRARIAVACAGREEVKYTLECNADYIKIEDNPGKAVPGEIGYITVKVDRKKYTHRCAADAAIITIHCGDAHVIIRVPVNTEEELTAKYSGHNLFYWCGEDNVSLGDVVTGMPSYTRVLPEAASIKHYISIEAEHFFSKKDSAAGGFRIIPAYGKTLSAVKAYPQNAEFRCGLNAPEISYKVVLPKLGRYKIVLYTNPSNPATRIPKMYCGISVNNGPANTVNMIPDGFTVGDGNMFWQKGVLDNIRKTEVTFEMSEGINTINICAISPNFVLEKLVIYPEGEEIAESYLGPNETYHM